MQFVPLWDSMLDNLKLHRLGPEAIGKWCYMLLAAQRHDALEGTLPDLETLSFWLRQPEGTVKEWLAELVAARLVDRSGKSYAIHDWDEWRCKGDKAARERMRRKRERDRNEGENGHVERNAGRNTERNVTPDVTPNVTPHVTGVFPPRKELAEAEAEEEEKRGNPPPLIRSAWGADEQAVVDLALERWGASNGDSVVMDLLRDYPAALVRAAMDRHWDNVGEAIKPALLRGICRGIWNDGWPPKVKLKPSPKARAEPPTNQPASAFNPPPGLDAFKAKEAENLKALAEIEARKEANGRPRPV